MRSTLIHQIEETLSINSNSYLLTGDLGFGMLMTFQSKIHQFFNCGVAEQNMTSVACGLAMEGGSVFTYSIGNFSTLRCLEQIRNDVCYHSCDTITVGAGFSVVSLALVICH